MKNTQIGSIHYYERESRQDRSTVNKYCLLLFFTIRLDKAFLPALYSLSRQRKRERGNARAEAIFLLTSLKICFYFIQPSE